MITVVHGTDQDSSYRRLSQLISSYKEYRVAQLDYASKEEDINQEIFAKSLFEDKKIIVTKNLLIKDKKIIDILSFAPKDLTIICWEQDQLPQATLTKVAKFAKIENFKQPPALFYFLDNLSPGQKQIVHDLFKLDSESTLWNIQHRFLLLILAKLKMDLTLVSKITKRNLQNWQWDKIKFQAQKFQLEALVAIYKASLRIDYLIKSGQTNLSPNLLAQVMLLKYL